MSDVRSMHPADRFALISGGLGVLALVLALAPIPWVPVYGAHLMWPSFASAVVAFVYGARVWPPGRRWSGLTRALCIGVSLLAMALALMVGSWFTSGD